MISNPSEDENAPASAENAVFRTFAAADTKVSIKRGWRETMKKQKFSKRMAAIVLAAVLVLGGTGGARTNVYADAGDGADDTTVEIGDEETPLAAAEDKCFVHWIILLLTLSAGGYNVKREFERMRQAETDEASQEA
jgi:hypothetical protein